MSKRNKQRQEAVPAGVWWVFCRDSDPTTYQRKSEHNVSGISATALVTTSLRAA